MAHFPAAPADGTAPAAAAYHPTVTDVEHCMARRTTPEHADRRWTPFVYASFQCTRLRVEGSDLCETCKRRKEKADSDPSWGSDSWHGQVNDAALPEKSHMAGSVWFHTKAVWTNKPKPQTAKQRSPRHAATPWNHTDMKHVIKGDVRRDLHQGIADNVIGIQLLRDGVCMKLGRPLGASYVSVRAADTGYMMSFATRTDLANLIYHLETHPDAEVRLQYKESEAVSWRRRAEDAERLLTENGIVA
jgi:hypothetical protein